MSFAVLGHGDLRGHSWAVVPSDSHSRLERFEGKDTEASEGDGEIGGSNANAARVSQQIFHLHPIEIIFVFIGRRDLRIESASRVRGRMRRTV